MSGLVMRRKHLQGCSELPTPGSSDNWTGRRLKRAGERRGDRADGELADHLDRLGRALDLQELVDEVLARLQRLQQLGEFLARLVEIVGGATVSAAAARWISEQAAYRVVTGRQRTIEICSRDAKS